MGREELSKLRDERADWIAAHRDAYLSSGGAEGHIMDLTAVGGHPFTTHCLVKYQGRTSGKTYVTPLCYCAIGGEVAITTSGGGADRPTQWHLNIRAVEEVAFQIATQAFRATWREPEGAERDRLWSFMVDCLPFVANYEVLAQRPLPIILMKPIEEIAPFKASDAADS